MLKEIHSFTESNNKKYFCVKDFLNKDLCKQSVINNLTRLKKAGLINVHDSFPGRGRKTFYSLADGTKKFIEENL